MFLFCLLQQKNKFFFLVLYLSLKQNKKLQKMDEKIFSESEIVDKLKEILIQKIVEIRSN